MGKNCWMGHLLSYRFVSTFLILVFVSFGSYANQVEPYDLHNNDYYSLSDSTFVYHDTSGELTIDEIVDLDAQGKFEKGKQAILNFGVIDHPVWIRFDLRYPKDEINTESFKHWYIEASSPLLDTARLYLQGGDGAWLETRSDLSVAFDDREINHIYSVFPFELNLGETKRVYIKMKTGGSFYVPIQIWNPDAYASKVAVEEFLYGMFYGGMVCIIVLNFLIYLSVKDKSYLYYIAYLSCVTLLFLLALGHGVNILDESGTFLTKHFIGPVIWLNWIFVTQFIRSFLETDKRHPVIDGWLSLVRSVAYIYLVLDLFMPSNVGVRWGAVATPMLTLMFPPMCIYMWRKGNINALLFLIAWGFNMIGLMVYAGVSIGVLPSTTFTLSLAPLGILSEAVLLSFALAERVKREQKVLEEADRSAMSQLSRYRSVFNNALEGIYQLSVDGRFIRVNPSMARLLGYGNTRQVISAGEEAVELCYQNPESQYQRLVRENRFQEELIIENGAATRWADHSARLVYDESGEVSHIEGTLVDITDRKRHENALKSKAQERIEKEIAKDLADAKSEFLASMSHDIRIPLTSIIGHSEVIKSLQLTGSERENAFRTINHCSQQLLSKINAILDYSKIEAEKLDVESVPVDIENLVAELRHEFEYQAREKGLTLLFQVTGNIPKILKTDFVRFKQILQTLLGNALANTKEGGVTVTFRWLKESSMLEVSVMDSGVGISLEHQQGLFDVFIQGSTSGVRKYEGVGFGLPISKQLANLLGGDLTVKSALGMGSEFQLIIQAEITGEDVWLDNNRLSLTQPVSSKPQQKIEVPALVGTVVLAEDNPVNQKLIGKIISKTGVSIEVVENGQAAVDRVLAGGVDLVFMDINMPIMDGFDATQLIKQQYSDLPVYALTAEIDAEELDKAKASGCEDCLKKPIEKEKIYAVMSKVLDEGAK